MGTERPLAEAVFQTDGLDLFVDKLGSLINVTQAGQTEHVGKEIERASSKRRRIIAAIACLHPFAGVVATVLTGES
jgi:hypothetical protein